MTAWSGVAGVLIATQLLACAPSHADASDTEADATSPRATQTAPGSTERDAPALPVSLAIALPISLAIPAHFRAMPDLAAAVDAAARGASDVPLETWALGDPPTGRYLLVSRASQSEFTAELGVALRDGLIAAGVQVEESPAPSSSAGVPDALRMRIARAEMVGEVWALALAPDPADADASGDVVSVTCVRHRARILASDPWCERLLSTLEVKP